MRMAVQLRPKHRILTNPSLFHLFSTSSSDPSDASDPTEPNPQSHSSSVSDYFSHVSHVRASLKQQSPQQQQQRRPIAQNPSFNTAHSWPSKVAACQEFHQNLLEFRPRSVGSNPTESNSAPWQRSSTAPNPSQHQQISLAEVFNKDAKSMKIKLQTIRENLKLIEANANEQNESLSLSSLGMKANNVFGRPGALPRLFDKELNEKNAQNALKTEFVRIYSFEELGEKLKKLRPEAKVGSWFTLRELSERLIKLREMDHNETVPSLGGTLFEDIRNSLVNFAVSEEEKKRKKTSDLGATPYYLPKRPKEVLVEKASITVLLTLCITVTFHKIHKVKLQKFPYANTCNYVCNIIQPLRLLKAELGRVRDEFKISESDCGSA
ncbi:hypothetical protein M0R45_031432 [Rubus argutus]|uniref:Uncharacterized protein n=1 Tax=Rubus argutus TaxID=59490 RepID=A0AAW1WE93_RUBAR